MLKISTALTIFTPNTFSHTAYKVMHPVKNVLAMNHLVDNDKILDKWCNIKAFKGISVAANSKWKYSCAFEINKFKVFFRRPHILLVYGVHAIFEKL